MYSILQGDWRFFWETNIVDFISIPQAWDSILNTGIGIPSLGTMWITSYLHFSAFFTNFGLSWQGVTILFWMLPILILGFVGSFLLAKDIFKLPSLWAYLAGALYITNTYFLLVFFGGQLGVAFGYSLIPHVFLRFYRLLQKQNLYTSITFTLWLGLQVLFDPRIVVISGLLLGLYSLLHYQSILIKKNLLYLIVIPLSIVGLLHCYWILPLLFYPAISISKEFGTAANVSFLSFADFSHTFSFLHPNWPENIFGKTYFLQPEFLLFPLLAFGSLLLINKIENPVFKKNILFFCLVALLSIFLAKGTNDPFGNIYLFLINNVPGFSLFRDSTKWYMGIALSYTMLIPFVLYSLTNFFKSRRRIGLSLSCFIACCLLIFSLRESTQFLKIQKIPEDYVSFAQELSQTKSFYRTYWFPRWQKYGYFSIYHPAIGRGEIDNEATLEKEIKLLNTKKFIDTLQAYGVKYIVVPIDTNNEYFVTDRKYNNNKREKIIATLERNPFLKRVSRYKELGVFELPQIHGKLYSETTTISYENISQTKYMLTNIPQKIRSIDFSEQYSPYWVLQTDNNRYFAQKTMYNTMKFDVPNNPTNGELLYLPQILVQDLFWVSGLTLLLLISYLLYNRKRYA